MKSELEKFPGLLASIESYWGKRHMGNGEFSHFLLGMYAAADSIGKHALADEIMMLHEVFCLYAWHADELEQVAA